MGGKIGKRSGSHPDIHHIIVGLEDFWVRHRHIRGAILTCDPVSVIVPLDGLLGID
jgi:hypothetical protein|tara:strand:+ start:289 stop:456 length:168 start_codon:yes stop_codon:yes gene_type:complete